MRCRVLYRSAGAALGALAVGLLASPAALSAQTLDGKASAVRATTVGLLGASTTAVLTDTGPLSGPTDARQASQLTGDIPSLLTGETLHATTIGWPDQVASESSLTSLALSVAGTAIRADFVMSQARAGSDGSRFAASKIDALSVNGLAIPVSGEPNQTMAIPGGQMVINEQQTSAAGTVVNAVHVVVSGVADVVIASSTARIQ